MAERCGWCGSDPLYVSYHDHEWGVPERDSRALWEKLILDGFQAGLSWITILRKREGFRAAFRGFDPDVIATWGEAEIAHLLNDPGIIRSRAKIAATISNAHHGNSLKIQEDSTGFFGITSMDAPSRTPIAPWPKCPPKPRCRAGFRPI
jgi:DNA-3-methyladenine glycosylase I